MPLLPGSLCHCGIIPGRVSLMSQIERFNHLLYLKKFKSMQTND